jgi:exodeoxyribonuclease V alpha subunit
MSSFFENEPYYHDHLEHLQDLKFHSIILSTLKKGPLGVDALNESLHKFFMNKKSTKRYFIEPIMILENSKEDDLFNGETGFRIFDFHTKTFSFFIKNQGLNSLNLSYTPCYALSVHKSQGSEYDHVLFMVPEGSENFSREIVYTACTRVKKTLKLWFSKDPFKQAMLKKAFRQSGVLKRYSQAFTASLH